MHWNWYLKSTEAAIKSRFGAAKFCIDWHKKLSMGYLRSSWKNMLVSHLLPELPLGSCSLLTALHILAYRAHKLHMQNYYATHTHIWSAATSCGWQFILASKREISFWGVYNQNAFKAATPLWQQHLKAIVALAFLFVAVAVQLPFHALQSRKFPHF